MTFLERTLSRRRLVESGAVAGLGGAALALVGCGDDDDDEETATPTQPSGNGGNGGEPMSFNLVDGWYRDQAVVYYDFGTNSPANGATVASAPIWAFITGMDDEGNPLFVEGQRNVIDVVPGDAGYSDLWEVNLVVVPEGYEADSLKSAADVQAAGHEMLKPGLFVNCPVVPEGSMLENGEELVQGWYRGDPVFYPDFGFNGPFAIPIWVFITGMNDDGTPAFVEGQNNIIDALPADDGYSAFWQVNLVMVDDDYEPNSIRSAADVVAAGYEVTVADLVVNCPVVDA